MKKIYIFFVAALFAVVSCKKEASSGGGNCPLTPTTLPGVYKTVAVTYQVDA